MSRTARRGQRPRRAALPPPHGREPFERSPASPERPLLESIASGEVDTHLPAIARAIDARLHPLYTIESIDALAALVVGDHVRIDQHARPRYLQGLHATVIDVEAQTATISLRREEPYDSGCGPGESRRTRRTQRRLEDRGCRAAAT